LNPFGAGSCWHYSTGSSQSTNPFPTSTQIFQRWTSQNPTHELHYHPDAQTLSALIRDSRGAGD